MQTAPKLSQPGFNYLTLQTTKACNLRCRYCYLDPSREERKQKLSVETTCRVLTDLANYHEAHRLPQDIAIVFHGGETLVLGHSYFRSVLKHVAALRVQFPRKRIHCSIQSNITLLDEAYCELFKEHNVSIGTSIDGPADLHNANRFGPVPRDNHAVVMSKIALARYRGLRVGALCLVTKNKLTEAGRILDFFESEDLSFKTNRLFLAGHAAENQADLNVTEEEYAQFTCDLFDLWYRRPPKVTIDNLMQIMGLVLSGRNVAGCSHSNCATKHVTVTPNGDIFTCGRTTQNETFLLGNVDSVSFSELASTPTFIRIAQRSPDQIPDCSACDLRDACAAGCMYEAHLRHGTIFSNDGSCQAFRKVYSHVRAALVTDLAGLSSKGVHHA